MNKNLFLKEVFYNTLYFLVISSITNFFGLQILVRGIGSIMFMQIYFELIIPITIYHFFTIVSFFLLKILSRKKMVFWLNIFIFCIIPILYISINYDIYKYMDDKLDDPMLIDKDNKLEQTMGYIILLLTSIGLLLTYLLRYNHWMKILEKH